MDIEEWIERPRGVLTKSERRYLTDDFLHDSKSNAERQREYRMRQHLRNSLVDFNIIASFYNGLFESVFEELNGPNNNVLLADQPLRNGIEGVFQLLYYALAELDLEEGLDDLRFQMLLHNGVSEAVEQKYAFQGLSVTPSQTLFKVNGTEPAVPLEELFREHEQGEPIRGVEMKHLYFGGWVPYEMYQEHEGVADIDELRAEHGDEYIDVLNSLYEKRRETRRQAADEDAPTEPEYGGFVKQSVFDE